MQKIKPKWIALLGTAVLEDGLIRQEAPEPKKRSKRAASKTEDEEGDAKDDTTPVVLRSDTVFEDGEISCEAWLDHPGNKVQFRLGFTEKVITFAGINLRGGAYGIAQRDLTTKSELAVQDVVSPDSPPPTGKWIPLNISVQGSLVELYVDGIRVSRVHAQIARAPLELVLRGHGKTQVRNVTVSARKPQAFVVMQFTDEYNQLFREVIQPVCMDFGYEVIRADNIYTNTLIVEDIAKSIREASLVLADITPNNPNVYYEVGFAHGIQKPTILLSDRKREKLPFDISGFRLLFYDNTIGGKSEVEAALRKHLTALRA